MSAHVVLAGREAVKMELTGGKMARDRGLRLLRVDAGAWGLPAARGLIGVHQAANKRNLVIELTDSYTDNFNLVDMLNRQLATMYKNTPNVWMEPYNEPHGGDQSWADWQKEEPRWVQTIRNAGFPNPIVINTPHCSNDISQIPQYHLSDGNIIYAWHRYADGQAFNQSKEDAAWANAKLSSRFAIIGDELVSRLRGS